MSYALLEQEHYDAANTARVFRVLLDDLATTHPAWYDESHQDAITDVPDCPCGHLNEAQYVLAMMEA